MTRKRLATYLVPMLALALLVPLGTVTGQQIPGGESSPEPTTANENAPAPSIPDVIPRDALLQRTADEWASQYDSKDDFVKSRAEITAYVTGDHPDHPWNDAVVADHIAIQNFETLLGKRAVGPEIVALLAQKQILQGTYSPSDPVRKYHDWLFTKHAVPATLDAVESRLLEITGGGKIYALATQVTAAYHDMADHGSVPTELLEKDRQYWSDVLSISMCDYDTECDVTEYRASINARGNVTAAQMAAFKTFEANNGINPETGEPYACIFIQCASASGWVKLSLLHYVYAMIRPEMCQHGTGSTCEYADARTDRGTVTVTVGGGSNHAETNRALIRTFSQTSDALGVNEVRTQIRIGADDVNYGPENGFGKAQIWRYVTQGSCGGGNACGTYWIATSSPDAYRWVFR